MYVMSINLVFADCPLGDPLAVPGFLVCKLLHTFVDWVVIISCKKLWKMSFYLVMLALLDIFLLF